MYYHINYQSNIGNMVVVCDDEKKHIVGLWIEGQKYFLGTLSEEPILREGISVLQRAADWLDAYFAGKKPDIKELPLAPQGGAFRQEVWKILCEVPYGSVITYGEIARKMASRMGKETMSAQAAGGAVAHNPISVIIPCHRVVGTNKSLTGYAGGIDRKIKLLRHEGVDMSEFFVPKVTTAP
ncbi:methylated-DNA--[protein]-cysteine S-methyltransferase [bacterium 1XD8-76]|nr:methylated-DNA--[protein]-cysteine S-methyltransferase [bacterium 1XD8-76]